ncbi:MAG: hypothetical protein JW825_00125 [Candidatus Methanofastidiosa archaeon]|nr:hypothetical protein [Candidatus Methanofastidiosa archaeon]
MEEDIRRILVLLEEMKRDIAYIRQRVEVEKFDRQEQSQSKRIESSPVTTTLFTKTKEKSNWDSDSIDGLIE